MIVYFDTSALVKYYVDEPGTQSVQDLYREADVVGGSTLVRLTPFPDDLPSLLDRWSS